MILKGLRTKLDESKDKWTEELPGVLCAYHTITRTITQETPFNLVFGIETVIPVEIGLPTIGIDFYEESRNPDQLRANLDLLEETRNKADLRMAAYRQWVARYYNSRVKAKLYRSGDLVLRQAEISKPTKQNKLSPNWEGPYRVAEVFHQGAYKLEELNGKSIPRT